ncbi:CAP domain-containing protein [Sphingomonas jinjuensis]|uniref:CAP domain-containing protein n=1 Tax=Sphingomonas jinjuensis TaxID=535907 RepID=UPI001C842835
MLTELNRARADPARYAAELRGYGRLFQANLVYEPGRPAVVTEEGVAPVEEAIAFLAQQHQVATLADSHPLASAALDHCAEQASDGSVGHASADGSGPGERMRRRGGGDYVGEVITYGAADAAGVVRQLIVDDGVSDRGHRLLVFADDIRFAGVSCGPHPVYRTMCVIDVARTRDGRPLERSRPGYDSIAVAAR